MRKNNIVAASMLLLTLMCNLTGCSFTYGTHADTEIAAEIEKESDIEEDNIEETDVDNDGQYENDETQSKKSVDSVAESLIQKYNVSESEQIAPFYNVDMDAEFMCHFRSDVNPVWAVTVHTDAECGIDSMVYQINDGYKTESGTDVVVKPGRAVLGYGKDTGDYVWGYAPIYYLCIRYDMESDTVNRLDNPVVVPFTVKSEISIPNVTASVNENGQFEISWNAVAGAAGYNIYYANPVKNNSPAKGMTRAECGYMGDHPELLATVGEDVTTFLDFGKDGNGNTMITSDGYVNSENFYDLGTYYVTAIDRKGNESFYSMAAEGWKYEEQLPETFEEHLTFSKENGCVTSLPDVAGVRMCDGSIKKFPISYELKSTDNGCATYEYSIQGTLLSGIIKYRNKSNQYEQSVKSGRQVSSAMYDVGNSINIIPENTVAVKNDSKFVSLHDKNAVRGEKIVFPQDAYCQRADIESARLVADGIYPEGAEPFSMFGCGQDLMVFAKADWGKAKYDAEIPTGIHARGTQDDSKCLVFADSAEEEYLALSMINAKTEISLADMPKLQNVEYMLDVLYKVICQNPYILGVKSFSYNQDKSLLGIEYALDAKSIRRQQEEIKTETDRIISEIITGDMNDEQKVMAIWKYLEKNTVYDDDACIAAQKSDFVDISGYEDSFSTYGIICRKKGVCQSYMHATKLLCNTVGVGCESLTGYLQNSIPHGWNIVYLNDGWCWMDTTNSMTNSGVPYFIYQTSYEFAADSWNYVLDTDYELDTRLDYAKTTDMSHDYYVERGLYAESHSDIIEIIEKNIVKGNGLLYIKCSFVPDINDVDFIAGVGAALGNAGYSFDEVIHATFGNIGQVMVIDVYNTLP